MKRIAAVLALTLWAQHVALAGEPTTGEIASYESYRDVIHKTVGMLNDSEAQWLAERHGMQILNLTWEDTGRYKDSSVGPNISDMTIQVQHKDPRNGQHQLHCMPVIRFPNFSDRTGDVPMDEFFVLVGNQNGSKPGRVSLREYLECLREYLTTPGSWKGIGDSLLAKRDKHVLVSAQACFLPIPKDGEAVFNPVLFNYQSHKENPAVLAILCTREGTSATIIDNERDGFEEAGTWGQRLFFNQNGMRASLTGKRLSDFIRDNPGKQPSGPDSSAAVGKEEGLNMVLLIQVPLKQKEPPQGVALTGAQGGMVEKMCMDEAVGRGSDVEAAVIGHGPVEGPFTEMDGLEIERDTRFPIRVTVQFYKATSNGVVSAADMQAISEEIERVYSNAEFTGSLVTQGITERPTEYEGSKVQPQDWWVRFWDGFEKNTGKDRDDAVAWLQNLYGGNLHTRSEQEVGAAVEKFKVGGYEYLAQGAPGGARVKKAGVGDRGFPWIIAVAAAIVVLLLAVTGGFLRRGSTAR